MGARLERWLRAHLTHDVRVPAGAALRFPARCVACGAADPAATFRARSRGRSDAALLSAGVWKRLTAPLRPVAIEVPACAPCARRLARGQRLHAWLYWGAVVPVVVGLIGRAEGAWWWWLPFGAGAASMAYVIVRETLWPPRVFVTQLDGVTQLELVDPGYARELAELNGGELIRPEDP